MPLHFPVERFGDGTDVGLSDCVSALGGSGKEEDLFLDVRGEVVEPYDLRHACCLDLAEVVEFGLVDDLSRSNQPETMMR